MPTYPLPQYTRFSYREPPRAFRSPRGSEQGRLHAGIDLYAPAGTPVCACEAGIVRLGPYPFVRYDPAAPYVDAIEIRTGDGRIMRYAEMRFYPGWRPGIRVAEGQLLGHLEAMPGLTPPGDCMLHFELYRGTAEGPLTQGQLPFRRRADLVDPTDYMDSCTLKADGDLSQPA
jgi:murein DD-endopeptidase MepM/ murein hydrolase activator NlpD